MSKSSKQRYYRNQQRNSRARAMNAAMMGERSGQGGIQDRTVGERPTLSQFANPFIQNSNQLFSHRYGWTLYAADWMAQKIIDIPVFDMFREAWDWKYKGDDNGVDKALEDECKRLKFTPALINAKKMERLVGGCVLIRITKGYETDKTEDPITPEEIDKGDIICYNQISPLFITKVEWEMDPSMPDYGRPKHYYTRDKVYHRSRLVIFDGQPISPYPQIDFATYTANWNGFGLSKLAPIWDVIMRANSYQQGASHLSHMASVWFALYSGLKDLKTNRQGNAALDEMRDIMETMSQYKAVILDGGDGSPGSGVDIKTIGAQFGSVPELLMSGLQIVCAAADIPASRFLGQAPGGLSTDDRSGLENYYNDIVAHQKMELDPILDSEKRYLLNSALGTGVADPDQISQEWVPLWNLSEIEQAQVRTMDTNNIANMVNSLGVTDEWAVDELVRRKVITVKPDLEEMERQKQERELLGQGPINGEGASETDNPRMSSAGASVGTGLPRMPSAMNAGEFDESKHKRDGDGKFSATGGGKSGGSESKRPFGNTPEHREKLRAKFKDSDSVEAQSDEIKNLDKSRGVSKSLIELAVKKGAVGTHENADTGWDDIAVTRTSVRDAVFHQSGDGKIAVLMQAKELIRNGIHVATTERNEQGQVSHVFAGKAMLDGELHLVGFTINEDKNGKRYYNHELTEMEKALGGSWPKDKLSREPSSHREPILSIVRKYLFVK